MARPRARARGQPAEAGSRRVRMGAGSRPPPDRPTPERPLTLRAASSRGSPRAPEPERDIVEDRHVGPQGILLEHHPDVALVRGNRIDGLVIDEDPAGVGADEPRQHPEERGLPGSGRPEHGVKFAGSDGEGDVLDNPRVVVALPDAFHPHFGEPDEGCANHEPVYPDRVPAAPLESVAIWMTRSSPRLRQAEPSQEPDTIAPDGSEIRLLATGAMARARQSL